MVRCFIGVFIPDHLKLKIIGIQNFIKTLDIDCKNVQPENLHITLSFLGEVEDIKTIEDKLDWIVGDAKKFSISLAGMKFIPSPNYVRVVALDVIDNSGMLLQFSNAIKQHIGGDVKPPHLTLCRVRKINKGLALSEMQNMDSYCGEFQVQSIQLIESRLGKDGPAYSILHESKLS